MYIELKHTTVQCVLISSTAPLPLTPVPHYMAKQDYSNSAQLLSIGFGDERSHGLLVQWPTEPPIQKSEIWSPLRRLQAFLHCWANMLATMLVYYTTVLLALSLFACHSGVGNAIACSTENEQMMSKHCNLSRGPTRLPLVCHAIWLLASQHLHQVGFVASRRC